MINFKAGDKVVCIHPNGAGSSNQTGTDTIVFGEEYEVEIGNHWWFGYEAIKLVGGKCHWQPYKFKKVEPKSDHSKSTIRNQQVLKRLAALPQVTERIEIPVRKQEGAEA